MKNLYKVFTMVLCGALTVASCMGITGCASSKNESAFHVAVDGSDENNGSKNKPFATPERAVKAVRELVAAGLTKPVTVYFHNGEYNIENLNFTSEDSGTAECPVTYKAYGDGEVLFNAGRQLDIADFKQITDTAVLNRLADAAKNNVKVLDLNEYGLSLEDIGNVYGIGFDDRSSQYNDGTCGNNCELFVNGSRLTVARYPNTAYGYVESVVDQGDISKLIGGTIKLEKQARERMKLWQEPETAWIYGYFMYDWADMATPIKSINADAGIVELLHANSYGYKEKATYYLYNVLEELDAQGEYYIDRKNMLLYAWLPDMDGEAADIMISVSNTPIITAEDVSYISFEGISFEGVRNDIIKINGNNITIKNCTMKNSYGKAISLSGYNNLVYGCEVSYMGKGGVAISGGDGATLTPGNSVVENCYIHHCGEVYRTYHPGITVTGCGNKAIHNEVSDMPHEAVAWGGNDHLLAYNYVHDVTYESSDAGAFYSGRDMTAYGNVLKYNLIENVGTKEYPAMGIYFDDALSGQTAYGNILKNVAGNAFLIGGGKDITVQNNIVIDCGTGIHYDARLTEYTTQWKSMLDIITAALQKSYYKSEIWAERYPSLAAVKGDSTDTSDPDHPSNPSNSRVEHNVLIHDDERWLRIADNVYKYSTINDNYTYRSSKQILEDGTYNVLESKIYLNNMQWEQIPYEEIGRYKD